MAKRKVAGFCVNQHVIYPTHGVGKITAIEKQTVAGMLMELFIIQFEKDKMILRVPTAKAKSVGLRRFGFAQRCDEIPTCIENAGAGETGYVGAAGAGI